MRSKQLTRELQRVPDELHELFTAVRQMDTLVCEVCYAEELREHPVLGTEWNFDWYLAMAKLGKERDWITRSPPADRESWFFREFQVVRPDCRS